MSNTVYGIQAVGAEREMPSVLWHCWLGGREGTRPVKNWVVGCWRGYLSGAMCRFAYGPADARKSEAEAEAEAEWFGLEDTWAWALAVSCFSKIQTGFTFLDWYRRTWVVPDKGPLNGCVCVCGAERHGKQESGKHLRNREEISRSGMEAGWSIWYEKIWRIQRSTGRK